MGYLGRDTEREGEGERERGVWLNSGRASLNGVVMEKRICSLFDLRVVSRPPWSAELAKSKEGHYQNSQIS